MIQCAECGKKNKDNATVCKYCGYNPTALREAALSKYRNTNYPNLPYQNNSMPYPNNNTQSCYYDAKGNAYNVKYDYVVTPVGGQSYEDDYEEEPDNQQMMLYPYNPALVQQQQAQQPQTPTKQGNAMAWIGYILAMFIDILAWPFCLIGLSIASKRGGAKKNVCEGGMMFTLLRLVSALVIFLVWLGLSSFWPSFFENYASWKGGVVKIIFFGWPIVVGSIFMQTSAEDSGLELAAKGFFYLSIAIAVVGVFLLDPSMLPIFS